MLDWMGLMNSVLTLSAVCIAFAALMRNRGGDHDDDTESRVRVEQNQHQLIADIAKLTIKMDELLTNVSDMQIAVALLKDSVKRAHQRIDSNSHRLDTLEQSHYANVGNHKEGTD